MNTGTLHAVYSNSFPPTEESMDKVGPDLYVLPRVLLAVQS